MKLNELSLRYNMFAWPIQGLVRAFRNEIEDRIKAKKTGRISAALAAE